MSEVFNLICVQAVILASIVLLCRSQDDAYDVGEPLILTPFLEKGMIKKAQELSRVKPDIGSVKSYSGYFTVNKDCESNLFFWYFPAQRNASNAPVVLFLQGGPGVSSIYSLFVEVGPLRFTKRKKLVKRTYSWNVKNNLLFIDQPVGTGYSFTGKGCYAENETVIGQELYSAVTQFFMLFPAVKNNSFYITGYSYAGHFIPALGYAIHKNNPSANETINLKGMMIGDGWMDAYYQNDMASYLFQVGLVDFEGRDVYIKEQEKFSEHIEKQEWEAALAIRGDMVDGLYTKYVGDVNILNFLNGTDLTKEPYEDYIQCSKVRKEIHVGKTNFSFYNPQVENSLGVDAVLSVKPWVEELLEHYPMVFFAGQLDIICSYSNLVNFLKALNWSGKDVYQNATRQKWCVDEQQAGGFKKANNLYDVFVRNAGHSVMYDQPHWAYVLVNAVTSGLLQDDSEEFLNICTS